MPMTAAQLQVLFSAEGTDKVVGAMDRVGGKVESTVDRAKRAGIGMSAAITAPLVGFGLLAVQQATNLEEAVTAATKTYGAGADFIVAKSGEAATAVGLSGAQYLSAATTIGVFGQTAGLVGQDLALFGSETISAAADLASF